MQNTEIINTDTYVLAAFNRCFDVSNGWHKAYDK